MHKYKQYTRLFVFSIIAFIFLFPIIYLIVFSVFHSDTGFSLMNYYKVFLAKPDYLIKFWRSLAMCLMIAAGQTLFSCMSGTAFAKYSFPLKKFWFILFALFMILPIQVTLLPNYILLEKLKLLNSWKALIIPAIFSPFGTVWLTFVFQAIPDSTLDAARMDGVNQLQMIRYIIVPNSKPAVITLFILVFTESWNMVEQPILFLEKETDYPLSVFLASLNQYGVDKMMKKKTWNAGCMILISLMICTILSIRIEKWMQIPVEIATISQTEEEKLNSTIRIPKSCYNTDTNMIFYLAEQEGVFGTKFLAFSKAVDPLSITADSILLPEEKDEKGQLLQIIKWSTYPLKDGDEVTIDQEGEHKKQSGENRRILEKQKSFFFLFGMTVLILIFIFAFGIKDLYKFPAGDYRKCVRGMLLILIGFGILWKITALVNIPREYLPPECILDLGFYLH